MTMSFPTSSPAAPFAVLATAFTASDPETLHLLEKYLICVDQNGIISAVIPPADPRYAEQKSAYQQNNALIELGDDQYLMPGMIDVHVHAPQWPQMGKALDLPLYAWLQDNTFPLEARFSDTDFARRVYAPMVDALLANGTTTAMYFASAHNAASLALAEICATKGQRALVGRIAMDNPEQCPPFYRDSSAHQAVDDTAQFIRDVQTLVTPQSNLVLPVITPRFIPSCTDDLLTGLGELAGQTGCHVQTHCSESDWAHEYVKNRFGIHDAQALHKFGLLTRQTIMAHCNFLSDDDMDTLRATGAGIAHCPLSNFYFANSVFPLRHGLQQPLHIGLATDIAGGHSPSMFDSCRHLLTAACALNDGVNPQLSAKERGRPGAKADFIHAFWLATGGGGEALNLPIGQLAPGFAFDALLIDCQSPDSNVIIWPEFDDHRDVLQKIIYNATRCNVSRVWVQGRVVTER